MTNYNLKYFLKSIHLPQYTINCKSEKKMNAFAVRKDILKDQSKRRKNIDGFEIRKDQCEKFCDIKRSVKGM